MTHHVHLLVRTGRVAVASMMRRHLTGYAVRFNPAFSGTTADTGIFFKTAIPVK